MKKLVLLMLLFGCSLYAQLLVEDFNYTAGSALTANGWTAHATPGTNPIIVSSGGLTYSGYVGSGIGNAALANNTGEDVNKTFTTQTSGTLYFSFLVNVNTVPTSDNYFLHLIKDGSTFMARVFCKNSGGNLLFGLSDNATGSYSLTNFAFNTTYLCVVKYGVTATGPCSLWVFSSGIPSSEALAGSPLLTVSGTSLSTNITGIAIRQFSTSQVITVDGIRVGTSWNEAPLPVELQSFTAQTDPRGIQLKWITATEVNNYGFEVWRKNQASDDWKIIAFIKGNGNSNSTKNYSYLDNNLIAGSYNYKLKQIDNDGSAEYSNMVSAKFEPVGFWLSDNYPNPFNPATRIDFQIPSSGQVSLKVFNLLGVEMATLVDEFRGAGQYSVQLNADQLASGSYIYQLKAGNLTATKKILLLK